MKRVACIGSLRSSADDPTISSQFMDIYSSLTAFNEENGIQGIFLVLGDSFFHVMEGESTKLANCIYKLNKEQRISGVSIVLNQAMEKGIFSSWSIRHMMKASDEQVKFMARLKKVIGDDLKPQSDHDQIRIDSFFGRVEMENIAVNGSRSDRFSQMNAGYPAKGQKDYKNSVVYLTAWPKPSQLKLTPDYIRICSRLVSRPVEFDKLAAQKLCSSDAALTDCLSVLDGLGLLVKKKGSAGTGLEVVSSRSLPSARERKASSDRFGSVLRQFIESKRANGGISK